MYQRPAFSELSNEERECYRRWWKKYTALKLLTQVGFAMCLGCVVLLYIETAIGPVVTTIIRPVFLISVVCAVWRSFLPCPRCGAKFSGWWGSESASLSVSECQECGLTLTRISTICKR
jgi:hypothetical protein